MCLGTVYVLGQAVALVQWLSGDGVCPSTNAPGYHFYA
jgi:hypothetical protein